MYFGFLLFLMHGFTITTYVQEKLYKNKVAILTSIGEYTEYRILHWGKESIHSGSAAIDLLYQALSNLEEIATDMGEVYSITI